ncbi:cytochrome P450 4c3-like [Colias croceus]|uniref:cytochrome P450 4c3-like n=1 Tax=Colias crocea TaxID=72248 RepID=UPI001E27B99A|nr:cytochrome P450 4c3-like [Colias croceus]
MILYLLVIVAVLWTVLFKLRRRRMYKLAALIPGPEEELPVIGVAHSFLGDAEGIMSALQYYSYGSMQHGIFRGWLGHILYFLVVDPVDLEMVLKTCLEKDDLHRFIRKVIGFGGIFAPVSIWRRRRKILMPAFSPKIVEKFVEVFSEQSEKLSKRLADSASGEDFSIWPFLSSYTLDSVCETAMGVKMGAQENPNSPFLASMNALLNVVCERIFHLWLQPDWIFKLFPQYNIHQDCIGVLHGFTDEVIQKKREELKNEQRSQPEVDKQFDLQDYRTKSFLDMLISLSGGERGYNNEELREEVLTLTIAGTDTSAVAIGNTLKILGKYPKIQEKLYAELMEVFGETKRPLVKEDYTKLKYLDRVVKETLRLFPPVPFIIRKVLTDTKLPSGHVLPAGSGVVVSIWGAHRDPKYWGPDAENFDPDRFLPERFNLVNSCSFMPFSNGPRNCLGYQYALMSVKAAVSAIVKNYKVVGLEETSPAPKMRVKLEIMMKAVDGYQISLEKRTSL